MSLPRYPEYKDSGVEWLGDVPAHWCVRRLGHFFAERREKVSDKDFPPLSVTKNGIVPQLDTAAKTDDGDNRKLVRAGDFVINSRSDRKGSSGASELDGSVSLINTVLRPTGGIATRFAHHLFRSVPFQEEYYRFGKGIVADLWSTNYSEMRNIFVVVPEIGEQGLLCDFLDRETARIDALIAEQEKLLALLAEKRQATISHAVTRGLDPNAPMKDSGIAWLGEVPAHWEVLPVKRVGQLKAGAGFPHGEQGLEDEELPFFKVAALSGADESDFLLPRGDSISRATASRLGAAIFPANTIVFAKVGAALLLGRIRKLSGEACIDNNLMALVVSEGHNSDFIRSALELVKFDLLANPGAVPSLNASQVGSWFVPCPPCAEQVRIARFLAEQKARFALLEGQCAQSIGLLIERRSAVISAAVTGQIDVRGLVEAGAS